MLVATSLALGQLAVQPFVRGAQGVDLLALSQDPEVKTMLMANTQRAHDHGAFGAPSFLIGRELWFGKDRLRDVEEAILAAAAR